MPSPRTFARSSASKAAKEATKSHTSTAAELHQRTSRLFRAHQRSHTYQQAIVQSPCTRSTKPMYSQYKSHVLAVQGLCTPPRHDERLCQTCFLPPTSKSHSQAQKRFTLRKKIVDKKKGGPSQRRPAYKKI